jgi:hypothetical protein
MRNLNSGTNRQSRAENFISGIKQICWAQGFHFPACLLESMPPMPSTEQIMFRQQIAVLAVPPRQSSHAQQPVQASVGASAWMMSG